MGVKDILEAFKNDVQKDVAKGLSFFKHLSLAHSIFLILAICGGLWFGVFATRKLSSHTVILNKQEGNIELLLKNMQVMNEPAVLLKIIREKAPGLPAETQARAADAIFRVCAARRIEIWLACGLAEVESGFNPQVKDSDAGAVGWFQVMTGSARDLMNFTMGGYSKERLREPITNSICGLNIFANYRDAELERGKSMEEATRIGLGHYNCGNEILNNGFAQKVFSHTKIYQGRFETSMKELKQQ